MMAFMAAGFSGCTNDVEMPVDSKGTQTVMMTVDVSRSADDTRSSLSQVEDDLACVWTEDDKLLVTSTDGSRLGVLTIKSINSEDKSKATFSGKLENVTDGDKVTVNYIYLGNKGDYTTVPTNNVYAADYSEQDGTIESLSDHDIMAKNIEVKIDNGYSYVDTPVVMERRVSFARFKLNLPDGVIFDENTTVQISGDGLNNTLTLTGNDLASSFTKGDVFINLQNVKPNSGSIDFYMTLLPNIGITGFNLDFAVSTKESAERNKYYGNAYKVTKNIESGLFYRKDNTGAPIEITLAEYKNPGYMDVWGSEENTKIVYDGNLKRVADAGGWVTNILSFRGVGGWATLYTYKQNAIVDGLLSSDNDGYCFYYQWGRWLGFPQHCVNRYFREYTVTTVKNSLYPIAGNPHNNLNIGYLDDGMLATYCSGYMGGNSDFTRQKAIDWSIMFAMVTGSLEGHYDYIYNNEDCKWEDRSGNPCPDGYRLPTVYDLKVLIPSCNTISGTYSEFKKIANVKYAMQWKVGKDEYDYNYVEIKSIKSNLDDIDKVDFNNAPSIRLYAYGYIDSRLRPAQRLLLNQLGMYWSNESGNSSENVNNLDYFNGRGGKYLSVIFNNGNVNFSIRVAPRTFGGCVLPIKHDDAKSSSVTPWLPYCGRF